MFARLEAGSFFAAVVALATSSPAFAGTVSVVPIDIAFHALAPPVPGVKYEGSAGQVNHARVSANPQGATITDRSGIVAGQGCRYTNPADNTEVVCPAPAGLRIFALDVELGDRNDTASVAATGIATAFVRDGPGNDVVRANVAIYDGSGNDRITASARADRAFDGPGNDVYDLGAGNDRWLTDAQVDGYQDIQLSG